MNREAQQKRAITTSFTARSDDGKKYVEGYFAVFGDVYELWPGVTESIDPTAFDGALSGDIRALIDHETRLVLGRTKVNTLELKIDSRGLWGKITINENDTDALNLYARVQRGDVDQCSFGFDILEEQSEYKDDGTAHFIIKAVKLYEVSCVTFPAYTETNIKARKAQYDDQQKRKAQMWKEKMKERINKNGISTIVTKQGA